MKRAKILLTAILLIIAAAAYGQMDDDEYYRSYLDTTVKNENVVKKPVIGVGFGVMNFYGEIHDPIRLPVTGAPAFKLNVATFLDGKHYLKTNFVILTGSVTGNEHSGADTARNLNFKSDIFSIGVNVHYDFSPFIRNKAYLRPFISMGIENLQYNSKTDFLKGTNKYFYWNDGTIRDQPQISGSGAILKRDFDYETDLRDLNRNGLGSYSQNTFAIPLEVGVDLRISSRINLRIGNSWHYTFTDYMDDVTPKGTFRKGDKLNDWFTFSYLSFHMDLLSTAEDKLIERLAVEVNGGSFNTDFLDDEDVDGVPDNFDQCPATPRGVPVDYQTGCPLDQDGDGVYDLYDKEPNTPPGAIVDETGVQLNPEDYGRSLNMQGITRKEVEAFLMMRKAQSRMRGRASIPIPPKFKSVDTDGDAYISFDELVKSMNDFFDSSNDFTTKDIYELQDFFFEQ